MNKEALKIEKESIEQPIVEPTTTQHISIEENPNEPIENYSKQVLSKSDQIEKVHIEELLTEPTLIKDALTKQVFTKQNPVEQVSTEQTQPISVEQIFNENKSEPFENIKIDENDEFKKLDFNDAPITIEKKEDSILSSGDDLSVYVVDEKDIISLEAKSLFESNRKGQQQNLNDFEIIDVVEQIQELKEGQQISQQQKQKEQPLNNKEQKSLELIQQKEGQQEIKDKKLEEEQQLKLGKKQQSEKQLKEQEDQQHYQQQLKQKLQLEKQEQQHKQEQQPQKEEKLEKERQQEQQTILFKKQEQSSQQEQKLDKFEIIDFKDQQQQLQAEQGQQKLELESDWISINKNDNDLNSKLILEEIIAEKEDQNEAVVDFYFCSNTNLNEFKFQFEIQPINIYILKANISINQILNQKLINVEEELNKEMSTIEALEAINDVFLIKNEPTYCWIIKKVVRSDQKQAYLYSLIRVSFF